MSDPSASTCSPWATVDDVCAPCSDYGFDEALLELGLQAASDHLWNLTGRRWSGLCTDLVRPTACGCNDGWPGLWVPPGVAIGTLPGCGCGCNGVSEVRLPGYPVTAIVEVLIDGVVVDPGDYRVDGRRKLVWQGTTGPRGGWPCCQDLSAPADAEGTWSVEYEFGMLPPAGGRMHAATLGCQLALACSPSTINLCRLPKRVTSATRQGVTIQMDDLSALIRDGATGLPEVDSWVAGVLKGDSRRRGTAWVPGRRGKARRTT